MKKFLFLILFLLISEKAYATTLYGCTSGGTFSGNIWTATTLDQATCASGVGPGTTNDLVMNAATGNVTIAGAAAANSLDQTNFTNNLAYGTQTFTVATTVKLKGTTTSTSGTLSVAGGVTLLSTVTGTFPTLKIAGASTMTSGGFTWPGALNLAVAGNVVLSGNWINTGLVTYSAATNLNKTAAETLTTNGGLTMTSASGTTPTATIIIGGTGGVWSGSGALANNLTFNCTTATISGGVSYKTGTLTYTAGTITTTSSVLTLSGNCTLASRLVPDTNGISWNDVLINGATTITLSSNLTCVGILRTGGVNLSFLGAYNISCATLNQFRVFGANGTLTLVAGQTLTVTTALNIVSQYDPIGYPVSIVSSATSYFNYSGIAANCKVFGALFTNIDASGSAQGIDNWYGGTLTGTTNITNRTSADIGGTTSDVFGII